MKILFIFALLLTSASSMDEKDPKQPKTSFFKRKSLEELREEKKSFILNKENWIVDHKGNYSLSLKDLRGDDVLFEIFSKRFDLLGPVSYYVVDGIKWKHWIDGTAFNSFDNAIKKSLEIFMQRE
jgi:hypothetical protein